MGLGLGASPLAFTPTRLALCARTRSRDGVPGVGRGAVPEWVSASGLRPWLHADEARALRSHPLAGRGFLAWVVERPLNGSGLGASPLASRRRGSRFALTPARGTGILALIAGRSRTHPMGTAESLVCRRPLAQRSGPLFSSRFGTLRGLDSQERQSDSISSIDSGANASSNASADGRRSPRTIASPVRTNWKNSSRRCSTGS